MYDRSRSSRMAPDPILIYGAPRSGTTYVREILNAHPEVALTNEFRVFAWLHMAVAELPRDDFALFSERGHFVERLRSSLPALVRSHYRGHFPAARWWGDKNPHYAQEPATLETIANLFPGARFVHIHRDPRAVLASLLRKRGVTGAAWVGLEQAHVMVENHVRNALDFGRRVGPERAWTIRYETLVGDDEAGARALFDWLGIPFEEPVKTLCRAQTERRTGFSGPTTDLQTAGSREAARAAWRQTVPPESLRASLQFLAPLLLALGYEDEASLDAQNRSIPG